MNKEWRPFVNGKIKVLDVDYHRNGICGNGFNVITFITRFSDEGEHKMVGVIFNDKGSCAVLDVDLLSQGDIKFGSNSWRGDHFEDILRKAIVEYEDSFK